MLASTNGLSIGNTFFKHKQIHKMTWVSPDGNTRNELDYICTSTRWRSSLVDVRSHRGADVGSDHYLVVGKIRLKLKKLRNIWSSNAITMAINLRLYMSVVIPTATYACETWMWTASITNMLDVFHRRCLRTILRISWRDHITNEEVMRRTGVALLSDMVSDRR
ncbi:hypothetical protein AAFF_G00204230 [Aldrovandia affinis]|uniref:Endonuclease/exonuclease/phosphatase domain-containing protein n=1 Tax=Aldrovandia affinis TaxID=143900 RepID=A0AAD7W5V5_9TELE|nr:hypothetical protein AAFF_G00204230 [Aldrovandia affinis]